MARMSGWLVAVVLFVFSGGFTGAVSAAQDLSSSLITAFRKGKANTLMPWLASSVSLWMPGEEARVISREQVRRQLQQFFSAHPPRAFRLLHKGTTSQNQQYFLGKYTDQKGAVFRIYCVARPNGKMQIVEIRITKEKG